MSISRSGSATQLRHVQTARIKDGRLSNDWSPQKNNYLTAQKMGGIYKYLSVIM